MKDLQFYTKNLMRICSVLFFCMFVATTLSGQTTITHDIGMQGDLIIPGSSTNNYVLTGTTAANTVIVESGYHGTITLRNLSMTSSKHPSGGTGGAQYTGLSGYSCITVEGQDGLNTNLTPVTKVNFVLEGTNTLRYGIASGYGYYCALQVNQGAQIQISAIDPNNNASGTLHASVQISSADGAAIGGPSTGHLGTAGNGGIAQGPAVLTCTSTPAYNTTFTSGGNVIITSGTVVAIGGHSAGIGGPRGGYYDGIVIITGGNVTATSQRHSAGIGSGCPHSGGLEPCYTQNSAIIVLPPATISAMGAIEANQPSAAWALAGMKNITYINDPNKPLITVRTVDNEPNATIYLDLTETPGLASVFNAVLPEFALNKVAVGRTDASFGLLQFNGLFEQNTTFFTDASSSQLSTFGRPYLPVTTKVLAAGEIVLPLLGADISFTDIMSIPLEVGYTAVQAYTNAHRIKVEYKDIYPMENITFALQDKIDFDTLIFLGADGVTPISTPTALNQGDIFYIVLPIDQGRSVGVYSDVLLIGGSYMSVPLPGYIRKIGQQRVATDDSQDNIYIKVTALPSGFSTSYCSSTSTVTLTLNIDHTGMTGIPYASLDVTAKYLITTESDYAAALSADPLSDWSSLNVPPGNNTNTTTDVSFSNLPSGTYYIHWYVESGAAYAHSLDVADLPRTYGGFGPYELIPLVSIAGSDSICVGTTTRLLPSGGGIWVSNNPSVASVTNDGIVTGIAAGSSTFTFTASGTGCTDTTGEVSVEAFPVVNAITGEKDEVCINAMIQLSCTPVGGIWTLSNDHGRIVGSSASNPVEVEGITSGEVYISYVLGTGICKSTSTLLLKIIPAAHPRVIISLEK